MVLIHSMALSIYKINGKINCILFVAWRKSCRLDLKPRSCCLAKYQTVLSNLHPTFLHLFTHKSLTFASCWHSVCAAVFCTNILLRIINTDIERFNMFLNYWDSQSSSTLFYKFLLGFLSSCITVPNTDGSSPKIQDPFLLWNCYKYCLMGLPQNCFKYCPMDLLQRLTSPAEPLLILSKESSLETLQILSNGSSPEEPLRISSDGSPLNR